MKIKDWQERDKAQAQLDKVEPLIKTLDDVTYELRMICNELEEALQEYADIQHALDQ